MLLSMVSEWGANFQVRMMTSVGQHNWLTLHHEAKRQFMDEIAWRTALDFHGHGRRPSTIVSDACRETHDVRDNKDVGLTTIRKATGQCI